MSVSELLEQIRALPLDERKELMKLMVDTLTDVPKLKRSLRELRGLGKEIWEGVDAQQYVDQQRDEWDRDL
jgi:hypothetical protein